MKEFVLRLRPLTSPGWSTPPEQRLRGLLKIALRRFGLRCTDARPESEISTEETRFSRRGDETSATVETKDSVTKI